MSHVDPTELDLASRCGSIELLLLDVDGVLTDGVIAIDDRGVEQKHFYVRDGSAIAIWRRSGKRAAVLSGRRSASVTRRAAELGLDPVVQGASDKLPPYRRMLADLGLRPRQVCYIGDDLPDIPVLRDVGLAACPADAAPEVRAAAHYVARSPGGRGAVRDVIETILEHQGAWDGIVASYQTQH